MLNSSKAAFASFVRVYCRVCSSYPCLLFCLLRLQFLSFLCSAALLFPLNLFSLFFSIPTHFSTSLIFIQLFFWQTSKSWNKRRKELIQGKAFSDSVRHVSWRRMSTLMCVLYQFGINTVLYFSVLYSKHISYLNRFEVLKIFMIFFFSCFPAGLMNTV